MEYLDYKMIITVTSADGKPLSEFTTWRADFITQALTAMGLSKLIESSSVIKLFVKNTLGEREDTDKILMGMPSQYSGTFGKGDVISVEILRNKLDQKTRFI
jgi:hypothetical protein